MHGHSLAARYRLLSSISGEKSSMSAIKKLLNNSWQDIQKLRPSAQCKLRPSAQGTRKNFQPSFVQLEDRAVPSTSSISFNFDGSPIPAGDALWFNAECKIGGLGKTTSAVVDLTNQNITFSAGGTNYTESLPDSVISLSSSTTTATASFDDVNNEWDINLPTNFPGNAFMGGGVVGVPVNLPGNIKNVTWTGDFTSGTSGLTVNWQWGAAVYTNFGNDYNLDNIMPLGGPGPGGPGPGGPGRGGPGPGGPGPGSSSGDPAGTPEAYKSFNVTATTGNGGNN